MNDDRLKELEKENAALIGILRMFLWIDKEAQTSTESMTPDEAYEGKLLREYRRAIALAKRWERKA